MNAGLYSNGLQHQKFNFRDEINTQMVDFEIECSDGNLDAHIIILSSRCPVFRNFVVSHRGMRTINLVAEIELPNITCNMMMKVLGLIYGEVVRVPEDDIVKFNRLCQKLRLDHWVKFDHMLIAGEISPMESSDSAPDISAATTISEELSRRSGEGESSGR